MVRPRAVLALLVLVAVAVVHAGGARGDMLVCGGKESPDFNGDGYPDVAIGQPGSDVKEAVGAGWVKVIYGRTPGAEWARVQLLHQGYPGVAGDPEPGSRFGYAVSFGDFDGDGFDDLAVGVPDQTVGEIAGAGAVHVIHGGPDGLDPSRSRVWDLDSPEVAGEAGEEDRFGYALAACDFNRNGFDDLAVGVPFRDVGGVENAGAVSVLYGSRTSLSARGNQLIHQGLLGVEATTGDLFGSSLAAGELNEDGIADLAVGAPWRDDGVGEVYVLPGSRDRGLTSAGHQRWVGIGSATLILNALRGTIGLDEGEADPAAPDPLDVSASDVPSSQASPEPAPPEFFVGDTIGPPSQELFVGAAPAVAGP